MKESVRLLETQTSSWEMKLHGDEKQKEMTENCLIPKTETKEQPQRMASCDDDDDDVKGIENHF